MQREYLSQRSVMLDVVRVLVCSMIVIWHIAEVLELPLGKPFWVIPKIYAFSLGGIGVSLFLVLSGLVLELAHGGKKYDYGKFLAKRIYRIYPIYWSCLAVGIIMYLYREWFLDSQATYFVEITIREWACSLTGTCAFLGWWGGPFLVTGWFIGVIMVLYMCFPFLSRLINKSAIVSLLTVLLISGVTHALIYKGWLGWGWSPQEWFPLARIFEFGLGIWLVKVVPPEWWFRGDVLIPAKKVWKYLAELSFPYFLVHFELRFLISLMNEWAPVWLAVAVFVVMSGIVSQGTLGMAAVISKVRWWRKLM